MKFNLVDTILDQQPDRIRTVKQVSLAEEYLQDHFPTFPVLPGVMMVEAMVQSARKMLAHHGDPRLVLGEVKALKFGAMVRPGDALDITVEFVRTTDDGHYLCKGSGLVRRSVLHADSNAEQETAVSGRFVMRPLKIASPTKAAPTHS
ncbi:MAG TPA: hypothetical protein VG711_00875 [Phycisphaerales bacterium]|nr:hypothetical protein [Phycisphaerales bacterium]